MPVAASPFAVTGSSGASSSSVFKAGSVLGGKANQA